MTIALVKEFYRPSILIFTALILMYAGGIISLDQTFMGFSNHGMLTVAVLFVVAKGLQSSTSFGSMIEKLLGKSYNRISYIRLMAPVTFISAFLNNTPVVASLIPFVKDWAKKRGLSASKFLIPLSYASIFGGICTLIGTSTNLVIHGLLLDNGMNGFSFFEIGKVGLPVAVVGILYFTLGGYKLLPDREDIMRKFKKATREFVIEVKVKNNFPDLNKSIEKAGLRHLKGLYLFQIIRKNQKITSVDSSEKIKLGDRLFFTGLPETIYELLSIPGLSLVEDTEFNLQNIDSDKLQTYEAVISNNSPLIGQSVRESEFRTRYDAVIMGIHRSGHRLNKKIGDIILQANDTLFILADKEFGERFYHTTEFSLISPSVTKYSKPEKKGYLALTIAILMIISVSTGLIDSMLIAASIAAGLMIFTNVLGFGEARESLDIDVLLVIASSFGLGKAIAVSGVADQVAQTLINTLEGFGLIGIIGGLYLLTTIYTEIITNNAAAALLFPIALSTATHLGIDSRPLFITIAIAASASFATPIGYQTNLMVYNPGGYKFTDFLKTGAIINIISGIVTTGVVYWLYYN